MKVYLKNVYHMCVYINKLSPILVSEELWTFVLKDIIKLAFIYMYIMYIESLEWKINLHNRSIRNIQIITDNWLKKKKIYIYI